MHLHEVDVDEERLVGILGGVFQELQAGRLDVFVQEWNADDAFGVGHSMKRDRLSRLVHVLAVDLEILVRRLAGIAGHRALGHFVIHRAQFLGHVGEPRGVAIGVGVADGRGRSSSSRRSRGRWAARSLTRPDATYR